MPTAANASTRPARAAWKAPLTAFALAAALVLWRTRSVTYAGLVVLGPFAGGVMRDWQSCCAEASLVLVPWGIGGLALALVTRFVHPTRPVGRLGRALAWWSGWLYWFTLALLSYAHALE